MISRGRISITSAIDLTSSMLEDGMRAPAVDAFASLGTSNRFPSNGERDLQRWVSTLFGFTLEAYPVEMMLQVPELS